MCQNVDPLTVQPNRNMAEVPPITTQSSSSPSIINNVQNIFCGTGNTEVNIANGRSSPRSLSPQSSVDSFLEVVVDHDDLSENGQVSSSGCQNFSLVELNVEPRTVEASDEMEDVTEMKYVANTNGDTTSLKDVDADVLKPENERSQPTVTLQDNVLAGITTTTEQLEVAHIHHATSAVSSLSEVALLERLVEHRNISSVDMTTMSTSNETENVGEICRSQSLQSEEHVLSHVGSLDLSNESCSSFDLMSNRHLLMDNAREGHDVSKTGLMDSSRESRDSPEVGRDRVELSGDETTVEHEEGRFENALSSDSGSQLSALLPSSSESRRWWNAGSFALSVACVASIAGFVYFKIHRS